MVWLVGICRPVSKDGITWRSSSRPSTYIDKKNFVGHNNVKLTVIRRRSEQNIVLATLPSLASILALTNRNSNQPSILRSLQAFAFVAHSYLPINNEPAVLCVRKSAPASCTFHSPYRLDNLPPIMSGRSLPVASLLALAMSVLTTATAFVPSTHSNARSTAQLRIFRAAGDNGRENEVRRSLEFMDLEPIKESQERRERLRRDMENQAQFEKFGDSLWELRSQMRQLSNQLISAIDEGHNDMEQATRELLRDFESRDPELTYMLALQEMETAEKQNRMQDYENRKIKAAAARSCLPQFNLDGLWVGKYGSSYDLINITYVGDTLIAEKVTGDNNVPKGAITFQADLHPIRQLKRAAASGSLDGLEPILLTEKAAQKWGTRKLPRYSGLGQVAEENFKNNQWMDGQLIIIGSEYFSFAWLPIEQQIFFGRPSPELALKMLRDSGVSRIPAEFDTPPSLFDDLRTQKDFVTRCLEVSHDTHEEGEMEGANGFGGIWIGNDSEDSHFE
jgi:Cyclin D1 binding domain